MLKEMSCLQFGNFRGFTTYIKLRDQTFFSETFENELVEFRVGLPGLAGHQLTIFHGLVFADKGATTGFYFKFDMLVTGNVFTLYQSCSD